MIGGNSGTGDLVMPGGTLGKRGPAGTSGSNHSGTDGSNVHGHNSNGGSRHRMLNPLDPRGC